MDKNEILERTEREYAAWQTLVSRLDDRQITRQPVLENWTVKDLIAHITWYEEQMVIVLQSRALSGSDLWGIPTSERNQVIYAEYKDLPLAEVRAHAARVHTALVELLESLTADDLVDPAHFPGMPADWQPWQLLAENIWEHYAEHIPQLAAWLESANPAG